MPLPTTAGHAVRRCLAAAVAAALVPAAFALGAAPATADAATTSAPMAASTLNPSAPLVAAAAVAPGAPRNVVVTDYNNTTVDVVWDAPATGDPTTLYSAKVQEWDPVAGQYAGTAGYFRERNADPAEWSRSWGFNDVPAGLVYRVEVYETNDGGDGPVFVSGVLTKEASTTATVPRNLTAGSPAANSVTVSWDAPLSDGGKPIVGYFVQVHDGVDDHFAIVEQPDVRTATFTGIADGTYAVTVLAGNPNGPSPEATTQVTVATPIASTPTAPPVPAPALRRPGAPQRLAATRITPGGRTTITGQAPEPVPGAPVLRYTVRVDGRLFHTTATSLRVAGLRKGPARIVARAVNVVGRSSAAAQRVHVKARVAKAPKPALRLGDHGPAVRRLQKALHLRVTGRFGKPTRDAVVLWQTAYRVHHHKRPFDPTAARTATDRMRYQRGV
jgi:hypothetical protein